MEYVIATKKAQGLLPSLPPSYKVDLAIPEVRLAIEVDGKTHKLKKWKFLDQRKTAVLNQLGWTVLRFWNEEIDQDLNKCVQTVMSTISRLKGITTTSQTEC
ncbi:endonuclease domain-containing protein [Longilinea arvoryzae]|uniref:endonuclease domain-containing protein n=1 Tax=Longilinea arvoryzae TaxID=360412 RepID=UPI0038B2B77E